MILYTTLYIVALCDPINLPFERKYVPKSRRWKRLNDVKSTLAEKVRNYISPIEEWFSSMEEDWSDYYARVPELEYHEARRRYHIAESLNDEYTPLTRATWIANQQDFKRRRKRKYHHPYWNHRNKSLYGMKTLIYNSVTNTAGEEMHDNRARFDTDSGRVGVDNRASACISHDIADFVGSLTKVNRAIKGFGGETVWDVYKGTIVWKWFDNDGQLHRFKIPNSYYVPQGKCRLLSPQHWARAYLGRDGRRASAQVRQGTGETTTFDRCQLYWDNRQYQLDIKLGLNDNVATFYLAPRYKKFDLFCQECKIDYDDSQEEPIYAMPAGIVSDDEADDADDDVPPPPNDRGKSSTTFWSNLTRKFSRSRTQAASAPTSAARTTEFDLDGKTVDGGPKPVVIDEEEEKQATTAAQELLRYHHRFGHASFAKLQNMAKQGIIPSRLANCKAPTCSACLFAKATRQQWRHKRRKHWSEKNEVTKPGEVVSVDQLISPAPGLVAQMTGILTKKRYTCATVYVDQFSGLGYVYLQKSTSADETIKGKQAFEAYAKQHGVRVEKYHADKGIFRSNKWINECQKNDQGLSFAGVNAHHSNGLAERRIRSLQDLARAMLIHQNRRWNMPGTVHLWPYALRMANDTINETPNLRDKLGRSPLQIFSKTEVQLHEKHWIPFGCPTYVLHSKLQSGNIYNKWESRARVGIYLGRSPNHGRNVALVLDRVTGLVSPQFHVKFDKGFQTVKEDKFDTHWQLKAGLIGTNKTPASSSTESTNLLKRTLPEPEGVSEPRRKKVRVDTSGSKPDNIDGDENVESPIPGGVDELKQPTNDSQLEQQENDSQNPSDNPTGDGGGPQETSNTTAGSQPASQQAPMSTQQSHPAENVMKAMAAELSNATVNDIEGEIFCFEAMFPNYAGEPEQDPLQVFKATSDPDTMYMHEAMRQKDAKEFRKAMQKEWTDQKDNGNFTIVHRSEVPEGATVLPAVWQMRRKRDIRTRKVKKYKARLNLDGSKMQYGKHYEQTYAPVASWNSIRTLLTVSALHNWHTRQIDYVLAFPQAPIEREIYMKIPAGFKVEDGYNNKDYVLKIHRNVYGGKAASRTWYQFLSKKLVEEVGFVRSEVDECVFYRGNVMYVLYTDDSILAGPDLSEIEQAIQDIKNAKLDITIEGDLQDFLGVHIERKEDGSVHLTQPHLIDQIINDLNMQENTKEKSIPAASSKLLSRHSNSEDHDGSFNYRSLIGKLNYLEKRSRPDIAYITHQCARFSTCPKEEHAKAIRWLARYLKGTRDKGTILRPKKQEDWRYMSMLILLAIGIQVNMKILTQRDRGMVTSLLLLVALLFGNRSYKRRSRYHLLNPSTLDYRMH